MKSGEEQMDEDIARMAEMKMNPKFWLKSMTEREQSEDLCVDERKY
jgi:hypothetical protein